MLRDLNWLGMTVFIYDKWDKDSLGKIIVKPNGQNNRENKYVFFPLDTYGYHIPLESLTDDAKGIYLIHPQILLKPIILSEKTIKILRNNPNILVVIYFAFEGYLEGHYFDLIDNFIKYLDLPKRRIFYITGDLSYDFFGSGNPYYTLSHWMFPIIENKSGNIWNTIDKSQIQKDELRSKHFLCLNRNRRAHRNYLVGKILTTRRLYQITFLSWGNNKFDSEILEGENFTATTQEWNNIVKCLQKYNSVVLDADSDTLFENDRLIDQKYVIDSYFNIVTESHMNTSKKDKEYVFITEKTLKPIVWMQPFIILGNAGTLQFLRNKGFETFPEIFDESYDFINRPEKRMNKVLSEINRLAAKDITEIHELYNSVWHKLKHNRNLLANYSVEKEASDLFWNIECLYKITNR